jgi:transcriptional regulator with XRE-family HTH domain
MKQGEIHQPDNFPAPGDLNARVGARVHALRARVGLTLRELAERIGSSAGVVSHLERGERRWNVDNLEAVAVALGVSARELLPDDGASPSPRANPVDVPPAARLVAFSAGELELVDAIRAGDWASAARAFGRLAGGPKKP